MVAQRFENVANTNESLGFGAALHARHRNRYISAAVDGDKLNLVRGHELGRIHPWGFSRQDCLGTAKCGILPSGGRNVDICRRGDICGSSRRRKKC